jgi:hypothetical protein
LSKTVATNAHNPWLVEFEQQLIHDHAIYDNEPFDVRRAIHLWEFGHAHFVSNFGDLKNAAKCAGISCRERVWPGAC